MTKFSEEELNRIARLSGLSLSDEEKEILHRDLVRIVPYMERITELDTEGAEEPAPEEMSLREDESQDSGLSGAILDQAPKSKDGTFTVPRAVE